MLGAYYLSRLHMITLYVLFVLCIVLFVYLVKSMWGRKKRNIIIFSFLLIVLSWYLVGFNWRLRLFWGLKDMGVFLQGNGTCYYSNPNKKPWFE